MCLIAGFVGAAVLDPVSAPQAQTSSVLPAAPSSFSDLAKKASPSVVNISVEKVVRGRRGAPSPFGSDDPLREFFERFFGNQMPKDFKQRGLGTGFIID